MPAEGRGASSLSKTQSSLHADGDLGHAAVLKKKRAAIEKLRSQNDELKTDLFLENKFAVRPGDPFAQALINKLQDEGDFLARKIVLEMRKVSMLDQQLQASDNVLTSTRRTMGGIFSAQEQSVSVQKQIKILENRLEKAYVKYNEAVTHNKELRSQIDNLRRERIMFMEIDKSLERDLARLKKEMAQLIIAANHTFEAKEKCVAEIGALKLQAEKEQQGFEEEWRELTAIIEEDKRERERKRAQELAIREKETHELLKAGAAALNDPSGTKKRASSGSLPGTRRGTVSFNKSSATNVAAEKVAHYGEAFKKIEEATGIEHIDDLVNSFLAAEDQNYTLFNYVNEVNGEIEKLEDQVGDIKAEIERVRKEGSELEAAKVRSHLEVEGRLAAAEAQAETYEKRVGVAVGTLGVLKESITDLFAKSGCSTPAIIALLGDGGITETNMLSYLSVLEQRVNEMLYSYSNKQGHSEPVEDALVAKPLTSNMAVRVVIEPPSTHELDEDGNEMEVEELAPLSRDNLEAKVKRTLNRKLDTSIKFKAVDATRRSPMRR